jgi:DNA-binding MarR family transcriptional regulator
MSSDRSFWELIDLMYLAVNRHVVRQLRAAGFPDIRPAHGKVFENLDVGGTTVTVLAERAQMTKQAMGELVIDLEGRGYLQRVRDPQDRRAKLVVLTPRGEEAVRRAVTVLGDLHLRAERLVGGAHLRAAREVLDRLVQDLQTSPDDDP